jgi:hypothetical protein
MRQSRPRRLAWRDRLCARGDEVAGEVCCQRHRRAGRGFCPPLARATTPWRVVFETARGEDFISWHPKSMLFLARTGVET